VDAITGWGIWKKSLEKNKVPAESSLELEGVSEKGKHASCLVDWRGKATHPPKRDPQENRLLLLNVRRTHGGFAKW